MDVKIFFGFRFGRGGYHCILRLEWESMGIEFVDKEGSSSENEVVFLPTSVSGLDTRSREFLFASQVSFNMNLFISFAYSP